MRACELSRELRGLPEASQPGGLDHLQLAGLYHGVKLGEAV